jgi:hypothetical protein
MEVDMLEENNKRSLSWGMIIAVAFLLSISLGGLLYFFMTPVR